MISYASLLRPPHRGGLFRAPDDAPYELATERPARVRELNLYQQCFELVTAGTKTIEVRGAYPHLADLTAGDTIQEGAR